MKFTRTLALFLIVLARGSDRSSAETTVSHLRCEDLSNPLGVDAARPRFGWEIESTERRVKQTAYRVLVASTPEMLANDRGDLWDSGRVASGNSIQIEYGGRPLTAAQACWWKARVWTTRPRPGILGIIRGWFGEGDGDGGGWSATASFSTGLLAGADWHSAQWIAFSPEESWRTRWAAATAAETAGVKSQFPWLTGQGLTIWEHAEAAHGAYDASPLFRREFVVKPQVSRAILSICGLGYYEAFLNGKRVGDHVLDPAWTDYDKRAFYANYDVSALLVSGANAIGVMLGRGQFSPLCNDIWGLRSASWVDQPRLIVRLAIFYKDGPSEDLVTDSGWRTAPGSIVYDDTRYGEIYDARQNQPGWTTAGFEERDWRPSCTVSAANPLQSQMIPPIREFPAIKPVRSFDRPSGVTLFDVGRNIAGWARVTLHGPAGGRVLVDYAEVPFDPELRGSIPCGRPAPALAHPDDPFREMTAYVRQQNGYVLRGGGPETFTCHFSYKGFQFVRVAADAGIIVDDVEAIPVHSDVASVGEFECSNSLLNQIQQAARLTFLNNFHSIQTDCPHREKQGWTADLYLTAKAAMFNFDMAAFYAKCATDIADTQDEKGGLAQVAPAGSGPRGASTVWPAALVLLPADLLTFYGDRRSTSEHFDQMMRFARNSLLRQAPGKAEIIADVLGDWASPLDEPAADGRTSLMSPPEGRLIYGAAAHYRVVTTLARLARRLGRNADAVSLEDWAQRISTAFNREFFDPAGNQYRGEKPAGYRQSANAVPLNYGLAPEPARKAIVGNLVENVRVTRGNRLNTGFVGTPALLDVLADAAPEVAYSLVTRTEYPGWGYMIRNGATTLYEQFGGDNSHDHPMFGCISDYFYEHLAGIQPDPDAPGFGHCFIRPSVVGDLTWVKAHHDSPHGRIAIEWRREGGRLVIDLTIPANTTATVTIPGDGNLTEGGKPLNDAVGVKVVGSGGDARVLEVASGSYRFQRG